MHHPDEMEEKGMAMGQLREICDMAQEMMSCIERTENMAEWFQNKLATVHDRMSMLHSYIRYAPEAQERKMGPLRAALHEMHGDSEEEEEEDSEFGGEHPHAKVIRLEKLSSALSPRAMAIFRKNMRGDTLSAFERNILRAAGKHERVSGAMFSSR